MRRAELYVFTRSDLAELEISPSEVIAAVREGYLSLARGESRCPTKLMMSSPDAERDAVSYSMLGYDGNSQHVGFKTSNRQGTDNRDKYYTAISLYDDTTGTPFALMDCDRVGASRTPATTVLIAEACARPGARTVLMIGTGVQGLNTLPYLTTLLPDLDRLMLFARPRTGSPRPTRCSGGRARTGSWSSSRTCPRRSRSPTSWWSPPGGRPTPRSRPTGSRRVG